jgi:predicted AAA+ superfamily ATPase
MFWREYLEYGYYPFYFETQKDSFLFRVNETINATIEHDLAYIFNIEPKFILKQLVSLICSSKPYELNISKLSAKIEINRNTLYQYIYY